MTHTTTTAPAPRSTSTLGNFLRDQARHYGSRAQRIRPVPKITPATTLADFGFGENELASIERALQGMFGVSARPLYLEMTLQQIADDLPPHPALLAA